MSCTLVGFRLCDLPPCGLFLPQIIVHQFVNAWIKKFFIGGLKDNLICLLGWGGGVRGLFLVGKSMIFLYVKFSGLGGWNLHPPEASRSAYAM